MGKIDAGILRDWNNGDTMYEADYEKEREIVRVAVNDNHDRIVVLENAATGQMRGFRTGTAFPSDVKEGDVFYRSDLDAVYVYYETQWIEIPHITKIETNHYKKADADTMAQNKANTAETNAINHANKITQAGGSATLTIGAGATSLVTVTFPTAFASAPHVLCSLQGDMQYTEFMRISVKTVTTTGAEIQVKNVGTSTGYVFAKWIARG